MHTTSRSLKLDQCAVDMMYDSNTLVAHLDICRGVQNNASKYASHKTKHPV